MAEHIKFAKRDFIPLLGYILFYKHFSDLGKQKNELTEEEYSKLWGNLHVVKSLIMLVYHSIFVIILFYFILLTMKY